MRVEIARHALDRVPLSIIFDDSTLLVNLNYFFMRDRNPIDGQRRRWEDVPVIRRIRSATAHDHRRHSVNRKPAL